MTKQRSPRSTRLLNPKWRRTLRGCNTWLVFACLVVCLGAVFVWRVLIAPSPSWERTRAPWESLTVASFTRDPRFAPPGSSSISGVPTITASRIDEILRLYNSPAQGTGQIWIDEGIAYNINPVYALAFFMHESNLGTNPAWSGWKDDGSNTHNVGNIICAGYSRCYGRFRDYSTWEEGIRDWYRLIAVEYIDQRGIHTVEDIIPVYAPEVENDVATYIGSVRDYAYQWSAP